MGNLDKITITGFKSIKETTLNLKSLNVLIGANGAGKSNLVSIFTMLNRIVSKRLKLYVQTAGGAETLLHFGQKNTEKIEISLEFGANSYEATLLPTENEDLVFESEFAVFNRPMMYTGPVKKSLGSGHFESNLSKFAEEYNSAVPKYVLGALKTWKVYHFHDTSTSAKVRKPGDINDNDELRPDAANLASFLFRLQETFPDHYKSIVRTIRLVAPFFEDFTFRPDPLAPDKIRLEWREMDSDVYMNAMAISDGTLRFISLATVLLQPRKLRPATIIIDEPELGLHPYAINVLTGLIKQVSQTTQVIISTQSVQLVNEMAIDDLIVVNLKNGASSFERPDPVTLEAWLGEYSVGELWEKNVLGGRPTK